jgi:hypothetical protein
MRSSTGFRSIRKVDDFPCKYCGSLIFFREDIVNDAGKLIPMNAKNCSPHRCLSPRNPRTQEGSGRGWN